MPTKCKNGEIWRVSYDRKKSKDSKKNKGSKKIHVTGKCIKATSQSGKKTSVESKKNLKRKKMSHNIAREKFGIPKCGRDEIVREGFKRNSKSGKKIWVAPTCVPKKGLGLKRESLFYIEPGRLETYGYTDVSSKSDMARHASLSSAVSSGEKPLSLSRRLNALATLTKNTNPRLSSRFKMDSEWVREKYYTSGRT